MKPAAILLLLLTMGLFSCKSTGKPIVDTLFTDSLINHYQESPFELLIKGDMAFWKSRVDSNPGGQTGLTRYASDLVQQFHLYGDMNALLKADSILTFVNRQNNEKEAGPLRSLASLNITRHRFKEANGFVLQALAIGSDKYASTLLYFDTQFELGSYTLANLALRSCISTNEYGYFFRMSKWKHLNNEIDSAVYYMQQAARWSGTSMYLKQSANSNIADLYMHDGELKKANDLYVENLKQNAADYHSLQGLGRIALLKDNNIIAAEKIFRFIGSRNKLPDADYNMIWVAEKKGDSLLQAKAAAAFAVKASDSVFGSMYNKYLIDYYTGILASPAKALVLAEKEINNRPTPQTYAWYAWCLHKTKQDDKAMNIFKANVSGKPLEALELYWMGKMMKDMGKGYNAGEFFKAAEKNKYDLSPGKQKDLEDLL